MQPAVFVYPKPPEFEENDLKYRNCCCHVRVGSLWVASIGIICCIASIAYMAVGVVKSQNDGAEMTTSGKVSLSLSVIAIVGVFIVNVLVIAGVKKERPGLLLPWLIITVIQMVLLVIGIIGLIIMIAIGKTFIGAINSAVNEANANSSTTMSTVKEAPFNVMMGVAIGISIVEFILLIWFFVIVKRTRRFLMDKHVHEQVSEHFQNNRIHVAPAAPAAEHAHVVEHEHH